MSILEISLALTTIVSLAISIKLILLVADFKIKIARAGTLVSQCLDIHEKNIIQIYSIISSAPRDPPPRPTPTLFSPLKIIPKTNPKDSVVIPFRKDPK